MKIGLNVFDLTCGIQACRSSRSVSSGIWKLTEPGSGRVSADLADLADENDESHGLFIIPPFHLSSLQGEEKTREMLDNMKEVGFGWVSWQIWSVSYI